MTDDQSRDPDDGRDDDSTEDGYSDGAGRRSLRFSERTVDFGSWASPKRRLSREVLDVKALGSETAVFKARVQRGGRISIPDAERESLGIRHGQIVQAFVFPLDDDGTDDAGETDDADDPRETEEQKSEKSEE
ncbi:AbrB/MazE/SpoVT family DNA-binding domain-containing protein [Halogeometricum luteum]|uniref:SpoVT-AbrB domain-containing protein n=1 Tax=Halogeometricum luteum TaxID=2950537 RepID=A0ABU2G366_9EURY|nr:hypothetical protein [Halogeometricum sp. S3BR5-2]MDS0295227.1 hypothetical protein [Halogeometricum sp. S3BR5-2]